jgi:anti-sigma regulatory factor (Ser/Thr protein kinase)
MSSAPNHHGPIRFDASATRAMTVLTRELESVARARTWLAEFLADRVPPSLSDDATLVISELVTNALRHGLGDIVARTSVGKDSTIHVSVTDSGDGMPQMMPHDPVRIGGLGLRIVDELATSWGVAPFPGGKTAWATIAAHRH